MQRIILFLCNSICFIINLTDEISYRRGLKNASRSQQNVLKNILYRNRNTIFGIRNSFNDISGIKEYQEKVPVSEYEDYLSYIGLIKEGNNNVLTKEPVDRFCLSSGTSSSSKLIPFTIRLKKEFRKALAVWLNNIVRTYPAILAGKSFWIVSPLAEPEYTKSSVPVGFEDDSSYFGALQKILIRKIMAIPNEVRYLTGSENYYYAISWFLLKEKDLTLISVWNPLVLINVCRKIVQYNRQLITDIGSGIITFPEKISDKLRLVFKKYAAPSPGTAKRLQHIFREVDDTVTYVPIFSELWPKLQLISCWTDSWASGFIRALEKYLPGIHVQGKGLLATEAAITIPMKFKNVPNTVYLPAFKSHFLEFKRIDDQKIFLIDQLKKGIKYEVIVTTSGGFYRYKLNDVVEVISHYKNVPALKFLGKSNMVCDLTGEKLNEIHVGSVVERIGQEFNLKSPFKFITPLLSNLIPAYILVTESIDRTIVFDYQNKIIRRLDELLSENYHYKNSRRMLQLDIPGIFVMNEGAKEQFLKEKSVHSQQGTVKIASLEYSHDWTHLLPGILLTENKGS